MLNELFKSCSDIEKAFAARKRNPFYNLTYNMDAKRLYKGAREVAKKIESNNIMAEKIVDEYATMIGQAFNKYGHCTNIHRSMEFYTITIEYKILNQYIILVDVTQILNGGFGHVIVCKFTITDMNKKNLISFEVPYNDISVETEQANVADSKLSLLSKKAKEEFLFYIKKDIMDFVYEFIDQSERRVLDGKSRVNAKGARAK